MRAETQSVHLEKMMQRQKYYPEYELIFPPFEIKKSALKRLQVDDILMLGLNYMDLLLLSENKIHAHVQINFNENFKYIKIMHTNEAIFGESESKKYEILKCSFGFVQVKKLEVGHKVSMLQANLQNVKLFIKDRYIADATLINVENEIAMKIKELKI
jgi:hypothetical protein